MSLAGDIQLLTESPGYEDIFGHFRKMYAENVLSCTESEMVDARRRYDWLDEFKRELDNFNVSEN